MRNLTIKELEIMITERVLCDKLSRSNSVRQEFTKKELFYAGLYAVNDIFRDYRLNSEIWARIRGEKVFLFHERSRRLLAELVVDIELSEDNMARRPYYLLLNKRGYLKEKSIADLLTKFQNIN